MMVAAKNLEGASLTSRLGTSPAFQLYAADLLANIRFRQMAMDERGLLLTMLCECWVNDSLPAELNSLARLLNLKVIDLERMLPSVLISPLLEKASINGDVVFYSKMHEAYKSKILADREARSRGGKMRAEQMYGKSERKTAKTTKPSQDKASKEASSAVAHGVGIGDGVGIGAGTPVFKDEPIDDEFIKSYEAEEKKGPFARISTNY